MSDLRTAAQKVVDAWRDPLGMKRLCEAMEALRDALAQPEPRREWRGLSDEEINDGRDQLPTEDLCNWSFRQGVYFAEDKLKEKNT